MPSESNTYHFLGGRIAVVPVQSADVFRVDRLGTHRFALKLISAVFETLLSMARTITSARLSASGRPSGRCLKCPTLAATNSMALAFLHTATQAPQPIQAAAMKEASATCFGTGTLFASGRGFGVYPDVITSLLDAVERAAVHRQIAYNREGGGPDGLDPDGIARSHCPAKAASGDPGPRRRIIPVWLRFRKDQQGPPVRCVRQTFPPTGSPTTQSASAGSPRAAPIVCPGGGRFFHEGAGFPVRP